MVRYSGISTARALDLFFINSVTGDISVRRPLTDDSGVGNNLYTVSASDLLVMSQLSHSSSPNAPQEGAVFTRLDWPQTHVCCLCCVLRDECEVSVALCVTSVMHLLFCS